MVRTTLALGSMLAIALIALAVEVIAESSISAADCISKCSTTDSGACDGSSPASCTGCAPVGPTCATSATGWSNNAVYGTDRGSSQISTPEVQCKVSRTCNTEPAVIGDCQTYLIFWWACQGDIGVCNPCKDMGLVTVSIAYSCKDEGCDEGG